MKLLIDVTTATHTRSKEDADSSVFPPLIDVSTHLTHQYLTLLSYPEPS